MVCGIKNMAVFLVVNAFCQAKEFTLPVSAKQCSSNVPIVTIHSQ